MPMIKDTIPTEVGHMLNCKEIKTRSRILVTNKIKYMYNVESCLKLYQDGITMNYILIRLRAKHACRHQKDSIAEVRTRS